MTTLSVAPSAETRRPPAPSAGVRRRTTALTIGLLALLVCVVLSLSLGSRWVPFDESLSGLWAWIRGENGQTFNEVVAQQRIPRTVLAVIGGAALAVSGALMQAITRNPIADPGILGVNTGAALAVVCGITFIGATTTFHFLGLALFGGAVVAVFVYLVGSIGPGGATPIKLALAGVATTAALSSMVSAVLLPNIAAMNKFRFWQVGGVAGADWGSIAAIAPIVAVAAVVAALCAAPLNALALGDDAAVGLGVRVGRIRIAAAAAGVALCASITAVAGPIAFVGLVVPHLLRPVTGPDQRWLMPLSALGGAVLLTLADTIGRLIGYPGETEAGIITAFVGAPFLVVIARRTRMRAL